MLTILEHLPLLSLMIWTPIVGGCFVLCTGGDQHAQWSRVLALIVALLSLSFCVPLYLGFDASNYAMQFTEYVPWFQRFGIYYHLGVDGIALPLAMLTAVTTLVVVIAAWSAIKEHVAQYLAAFLIMQGMMVGVFLSLDAVLFYVFWEAMLIPMYLCIGMWGGPNRAYASIKFFLFTFFGSALMLVALLYLYNQTGSFSILDYYPLKLSMKQQVFIFLAFFFAFAVKVPMWPVHTWLPDAHTEAPAGGSVVLAALMLKMGVYGFLRFSLPITPDACQYLEWFMIGLSLIAIVYIGIVAIGQGDLKRLIAYSSVAHMGLATLGCFLVYTIIDHTGVVKDAYMALEGAMVQMVSHAFSTGALFLGVGMLYDRMHTRKITDFGGVINTMPLFASFFMLFAMANVGLPGTSGFVGEFMVLLSAFRADFWITFFAATTLILSAAYTLWMYKRVFLGEIANDSVKGLKDIAGSEVVVLTILAFLVLFVGLYPQPLLNVFHASVEHLLRISHTTKLIA
ncbi:MAG: complex I subunit 4 family protein [Gammaproteobacteria bacterium]